MGNFVTFRMNTGKKEGTVSFKGGIAKDKDGVEKFINYWPGGNGIFDENNKKNAVKPKSVVFRYNDILSDPAVEIVVRKSDKQLLDYLMMHPAYGRKYKIHDEDEIAKDKSNSYDSISKAMQLVAKGNSIELQAMAVCVLGSKYHGKSAHVCKADLNERAIKDPASVISVVEGDGFTNRYLASTALIKGVVKINPTHTALIWGDSKAGVILHLAKGEAGLDKLTDLLNDPGEQGRLMMQELGNRVGDISEEGMDDKDREIAELKKQLAAQSGEKKAVSEDSIYKDMELEELHEVYAGKFEKQAPIRYKNDRDWIIGKLEE